MWAKEILTILTMSQTSIDTITHSKKCLDDITSLLVSAGYPKAGDMGHSGEEFDKVGSEDLLSSRGRFGLFPDCLFDHYGL